MPPDLPPITVRGLSPQDTADVLVLLTYMKTRSIRETARCLYTSRSQVWRAISRVRARLLSGDLRIVSECPAGSGGGISEEAPTPR